MQLALLGGGRMGEALLSGLLDAGWDADALAVAEVDPERRRLVEERFRGVRAVPSPAWAVAESDVVVLAVKPSDVGAALEQCLPSLKTDAMVLSATTRGGPARCETPRRSPGVVTPPRRTSTRPSASSARSALWCASPRSCSTP